MDHSKNQIFIAQGAVIVGNVSLSEKCSVWYNTTIRAGYSSIIVGKRTNIQDNCVLHAERGHDMKIGNDVTIGHGAIIHCDEIGDNSLIGMGAILLTGAKIGKNCIIGAGAIVTQNMVIPDNTVAMGQPAKIKRTVTEEEIRSNQNNALHYVEEAGLKI